MDTINLLLICNLTKSINKLFWYTPNNFITQGNLFYVKIFLENLKLQYYLLKSVTTIPLSNPTCTAHRLTKWLTWDSNPTCRRFWNICPCPIWSQTQRKPKMNVCWSWTFLLNLNTDKLVASCYLCWCC